MVRLSGVAGSHPPMITGDWGDDVGPYQSCLHLHTDGGLPAPVAGDLGPGPGPTSDATDTDLAGVKRMAVDPVVVSLIRADELDSVAVQWGREGPGVDIWVRISACGEEFIDRSSSPAWEGSQRADAATMAARLADHLEDWVTEAAFAWGQRRIAHYSLPEA